MPGERLSWREITPPELVPAIEYIRKSYDDAEWKCKECTCTLCYSALHPGAVEAAKLAPYRDVFPAYRQVIGNTAANEFDRLVRLNTPPAIFKAYFDAFRKGLATTLPKVFDQVLQIGNANSPMLNLHPVDWAKAHLESLVGSSLYAVNAWIRWVCDGRDDSGFGEDPSTNWQAPKLIHMQPCGNTPYDPATAWALEDKVRSEQLVKALSNRFVVFLDVDVTEIAGAAHVAHAQKGRLHSDGRTPSVHSEPHQPIEGSSSGRQQMAVDYPQEFSAPARARVEAEMLRGRKLLTEQRNAVASSPYGANTAFEEHLRRYILQVCLVFAREACKLGSQGSWTVDQIRTQVEEFLRKFTIETHYSEGHDKNGRKVREMVSHWGGLLPDVERAFRASAEWQQYEEELLGVALEIAGEEDSQEDSERTAIVDYNAPASASKKHDRTMLISKFLHNCNAAPTGFKVIRTHIWKAVGHTTARQFQYWQAGDDRNTGGTRGATEEDDKNFRRILAMSPADFRVLLQKKGLI